MIWGLIPPALSISIYRLRIFRMSQQRREVFQDAIIEGYRNSMDDDKEDRGIRFENRASTKN